MRAFSEWTVLPHQPVEKLTANLWRVSGTLRSAGVDIQRQMVLARMRDGRVVVFNGIALNDVEMRDLESWGKPSLIVVPNRYHRQDAWIWKKRYADAQVVAPPGGRKAIGKVVPVDLTTNDAPQDDDVRLRPIEGCDRDSLLQVRSGDEVTLVFCDTILNIPRRRGFTGFMLAPTGRVATPRVTRWFMMSDKLAFATQLESLAHMPGLKRLLFGHGDPITDDPAGALRSVVAQLRAATDTRL